MRLGLATWLARHHVSAGLAFAGRLRTCQPNWLQSDSPGGVCLLDGRWDIVTCEGRLAVKVDIRHRPHANAWLSGAATGGVNCVAPAYEFPEEDDEGKEKSEEGGERAERNAQATSTPPPPMFDRNLPQIVGATLKMAHECRR